MIWVESVATSKPLDSPHSHIKRKSVLKACQADMPQVCWGEHCSMHLYDEVLVFMCVCVYVYAGTKWIFCDDEPMENMQSDTGIMCRGK